MTDLMPVEISTNCASQLVVKLGEAQIFVLVREERLGDELDELEEEVVLLESLDELHSIGAYVLGGEEDVDQVLGEQTVADVFCCAKDSTGSDAVHALHHESVRVE